MAKANRVISTPRRTASKIQTKKRVLVAAAAELKAAYKALDSMHKKYGDDADSRKDYLRLSDRRYELLHIFESTPARTQNDIEAKALALSLRETLEDYMRTGRIAESLAKDILRSRKAVA